MTPISASRQALPPANANNWVQVAVIGDSIVHGGIDLEASGWVNRLRLHCSNNGLGDHIFQLGLGGNNSRDLLARAEDDLRSRLRHVDSVFFGTGTNDMNQQSYVPPDEFRANLEKLGQIASRLGLRVGFVGLTLRIDMEARLTPLYEKIIREVSEQGGYWHFPLLDVLTPGDLVDSCHPNAVGHQKICNSMIGQLRAIGLFP